MTHQPCLLPLVGIFNLIVPEIMLYCRGPQTSACDPVLDHSQFGTELQKFVGKCMCICESGVCMQNHPSPHCRLRQITEPERFESVAILYFIKDTESLKNM